MVKIRATAFGKKSNVPTVTSQVDLCPIPFHYDTYIGCPHGCLYCFARDLVNFRRRRSPLAFGQCEFNSVRSFHRTIHHYLSRPEDPQDIVSLFLRRRVPLKIGASADPCPPAERENRVTYATLKILQGLDYPVQVQTKRPDILAEYAADFAGWDNLIFSVTIISRDALAAKIEPGAPSPSERFAAIKRLTALGFPVLVRCQPAVYPVILDDLPWLIEETKRSGAWGFQTEGLKLRIATGPAEREHFKVLGRALGIDDLYAHYRLESRTSSDYELSIEKKLAYTTAARTLAHAAGLRYLSADNQAACIALSDSDECCGTERLARYVKFSYNVRTKLTTGRSWADLENGLEQGLFRTRNCPAGVRLKDYVQKKLSKSKEFSDEKI